MGEWLDRINGAYGSNTVRENSGAGATSSAASSTPKVRSVGSSDDEYVEVDFNDESVENLGSEEHTYEELKTMYDEKQGEVTDQEGTLADLQDNEKNGIHEAEEAYDEAVKNDEKISDELKEKQAKNSEAITKKEDEISKKEQDISSYESSISDLDLDISHYDAQMSKIQELYDMQPSVKTSQTKEEWDAIEANKLTYSAQIATLERQLYIAKTQKGQLETKLTTAKQDKETLDGELDDLNKEKKTIDDEILKSCSEETKQLKTALDTLKTQVATDKADAQTTLDGLRGELTEISNYMNNHASLDVSDVSTDPVENASSEAFKLLGDNKYMTYAEFNEKYGADFTGMNENMYFTDGNWCANTAVYTMSLAYGGMGNIPGNFDEEVPDIWDKFNCDGLSKWGRNHGALMDKREDADGYDLSKVKQGDLILFNTSADKTYSHVGIVDYIDEKGVIHTIEGNTKYNGDDNGGHGYLTTRKREISGNDGNGVSFVLVSQMEEDDKKSLNINKK